MATFISLIQFTDQGIKSFRDSPKRAAAFKQMAQELDVSTKGIYWTVGGYDGVLIFDAPDDERAAALLLSLASMGNIRSQTLRAFDRPEIESVINQMP